MQHHTTTGPREPQSQSVPGVRPRILDSAQLLGVQQEIQIRHHGAVYTLRQTRQGKLILTK